MDTQIIVGGFFLLIFIVAIFIVIRKAVWWYWGIDQHLANQRKIIELLSERTRNVSKPVITRTDTPTVRLNPLTGK